MISSFSFQNKNNASFCYQLEPGYNFFPSSLRVCLVQEAPVLRSAAIRVLRFLLCREEDVIIFGSVGIPTLIARSFDIILNNAGERIQAIRLCQKILSIPGGAKHFPVPITRALISIGFDGELEQDKLHRSSLSLLCQLGMLSYYYVTSRL